MDGEQTTGSSMDLWKFGPTWALGTLTLLAVVAFGVYGYAQQVTHGEIVTGLRTVGSGGVAWGLYIVFVVFFIGISFAGITIAALIRLFEIKAIEPLARLAELLTIVSLLLGACCVLADLGRPLHGLLNLPRYARPTSPFFGTFTMVIGGYLFASLVYFFLAGRADAALCAERSTRLRWFYRLWASGYEGTAGDGHRHHQVSFWLSLFILPLLVTAHSTLGFIFGIQGGRPGWYGTLQAPNFVVMAGVSGTGAVIVISAALRRAFRLQGSIRLEAFKWLGNMLWVLVVISIYFLISEELTASYAASENERRYAHELATGRYATLFWIEVGALVVPFLILFGQFVTGYVSIPLMVISGLLVNVAAILKRYLLVVASQTHGMMLPYAPGEYAPSWVEFSIVIGLGALGILVYWTFAKIFPIVPLAAHHPRAAKDTANAAAEPRGRTGLLTALWFTAGLAIAVTGFLLSARVGTQRFLDPMVPFSPVIYIIGVMLVFSAGAVYEVAPALARAMRKRQHRPSDIGVDRQVGES